MRIDWVKGRGFAVHAEALDRPHLDRPGPWVFKTFESASRFAEAAEAKISGAWV